MALYTVRTRSGDIVAECSSLEKAIEKAETQRRFKKKKLRIYCLRSCETLSLAEAGSRLEEIEKGDFEKSWGQAGSPGLGKRR